MNHSGIQLLKRSLALLAAVLMTAGLNGQKPKAAGNLVIKSIELGYPVPARPFYHFIAHVSLPQPSIIEVEATVNGKVLRATDLRRESDVESVNRPPISERPPSGYSLSQDGTKYQDFSITGWVRWEPGESYNIRIAIKLKKSVHGSADDVWISETRTIKAPEGANVFAKDWKSYKSIVLTETAGIARTKEPVEALLAFYPDEAQQLARDIRVVSYDPSTHNVTEVPCQVYDQMEFTKEDDLGPDKDGNPTRKVPLWLPTVTVRVAFLADVPARTSRIFLVYYNNPKAMAKLYQSDLRVQGDAPGLQIDNSAMTISLHPNSGHLDQMVLKSRPDFPLYHRLETNGAMHWNPDIYVPPRAWTHTADWKAPKNIKTISGPVIARSDIWDEMREVPEVDASVRYEFYPGVPYFISSTCMRINQTVNALALRNSEMVLRREMITHAAWYDVLTDSVIVYDVSNMADLTDLKMEADVPWIIFFNKETGIGFAGIQLSYANAGIESPPRVLNPFFYITAGPWIYWARGISHTFLSSNNQQVIPVLKGNVFSEKWAYLIYEFDKNSRPYDAVVSWQKRLTNPLRMQLVEEVDDRVSKTLQEVFMDKGKSGWEGRDTHKNKD